MLSVSTSITEMSTWENYFLISNEESNVLSVLSMLFYLDMASFLLEWLLVFFFRIFLHLGLLNLLILLPGLFFYLQIFLVAHA